MQLWGLSMLRRLPGPSWAMGCMLLLCAFGTGQITTSGITFPLAWRWSNPQPHGNNIIDIAFGKDFAVQVAERGQMYTSTDLKTWNPVNTGTTRSLRAVTFFKDQLAVTGESGTILFGATPTDLKVGNLGTEDWLEGVAASPQVLVAVGDNAAIYTTEDGTNWQRRSAPFTDWLRSVTYGTPGNVGTFVAVGESGIVATSQDGAQWQVQSRFTQADLNSVHWFNGEFWVVGTSGVTFQSSSGTKWQAVNTGAANSLNAFAAAGSLRLVAGESEVRLRNRGTWNNELANTKPFPPPNWNYLCAATITNAFLLCGRTGMMAEGLIATNGANVWFPLSDSLWNWLWDVKRFPNLYLAVGERATIMSSLDGATWAAELPPAPVTSSVLLGIGGRTNLAIAVGSTGTIITSGEGSQTVVSTNSDGTISTNVVSTFGIYWQAVSPAPTTVDLQGVCTFGDLCVVSGGTGTILTSPDGTNWTKRSTPTSGFLSSVDSFPGGIVAAGKDGVMLFSTDAIQWSLLPQFTTNWVYRVRYLGGRLIAVGENGTILTSSDGTAWTTQSSGTGAWLNDVQYLDNTYFAIGNQGTVLTSPDAIVWTDRGTITGKSLFGAAAADGMLVVVGVEGVILRSQILPVDSTVKFLKFPARFDQNQFLFSGRPGQRFTLDRSTNIQSWNPGPVLQIEGTGTLPFTAQDPNSPEVQFFRATPQP